LTLIGVFSFTFAILSFFILAGNILQHLLHAINGLLRSCDLDPLAKTEDPRVEGITERNGDDDFGMSLVMARDHHLITKPVNNGVCETVDGDQRDAFNLSTMHGEGVIGVVADVRDGFEVCLGNQCFFCITL